MNTTNDIRSRVTEIVNAGLVTGVGNPIPGQMCLEAAICFALGETHGDQPSCVAEPDRVFAIRLQDTYPGTPEERAELFLPLGLAQLNTTGSDRMPWVRALVGGTVRKVLPEWLRLAATKCPDHSSALLAAAERCTVEGTKQAVLEAKRASDAAADRADRADRAAYAAYAAAAAAYAAAAAADATYAAATYAAAYAADVAAAAAYAADADRRRILEISVAVALEAYKAEGRHQ